MGFSGGHSTLFAVRMQPLDQQKIPSCTSHTIRVMSTFISFLYLSPDWRNETETLGFDGLVDMKKQQQQNKKTGRFLMVGELGTRY